MKPCRVVTPRLQVVKEVLYILEPVVLWALETSLRHAMDEVQWPQVGSGRARIRQLSRRRIDPLAASDCKQSAARIAPRKRAAEMLPKKGQGSGRVQKVQLHEIGTLPTTAAITITTRIPLLGLIVLRHRPSVHQSTILSTARSFATPTQQTCGGGSQIELTRAVHPERRMEHPFP